MADEAARLYARRMRAFASLALSFVLALPSAGCAGAAPCPEAPRADAGAEEAIRRVLDDWHDAAAHADEARYFSHLGADSVFMGTDATERWSKEAFVQFAKPHFAKGKAWSFRATRRAIVVQPGGAFAHFDEDLATEGLGPARGSGVVALREGKWVIVHYNLAITVPNDRFDLAKDAAGAAKLLTSEKGPLDAVGILVGSWTGKAGADSWEEHWTHAAGGTLVGAARAVGEGKTKFWEALRIETHPNNMVYVAQPKKGPPTDFALSPQSTKTKLVFENPQHDFPKRITYELVGRELRVEIAGAPGGPKESWTMERAVVARPKP